MLFGSEANEGSGIIMATSQRLCDICLLAKEYELSTTPPLFCCILNLFRVADADLLKKLKGDYIKSMDDSALKSVNALLELFAADLCECFPFLHSAVGTLSVAISLTGINVYSAIHPTGALL